MACDRGIKYAIVVSSSITKLLFLLDPSLICIQTFGDYPRGANQLHALSPVDSRGLCQGRTTWLQSAQENKIAFLLVQVCHRK